MSEHTRKEIGGVKMPLAKRVEKALRKGDVTTASEGGGITCDLCNDGPWWAENGFTDDERQAMCGPQGINCPGFGGPGGG